MNNPQETLKQFAGHVSRYTINLNERVSKEENCTILRGGNAIVYSGILRPGGTRVAIKAARGGLPGEERVIKFSKKFISGRNSAMKTLFRC